MILNVSGRTDIVAFYSEWFMKRYNEGFVDVRNPFYPKLVSRIYFDDVDLIVFCTKNPHSIIPFIANIEKPILFHITLTPYKKDIEPYVPNKRQIIEDIKKLSQILGKEKIYVRYDPIFLNDTYNIEYHIRAFTKMCTLLEGFVTNIIVSFIDDYKNVRKNLKILKIKSFTTADFKVIGLAFSKIAKNHHMTVQTCGEFNTLENYGFKVSDCLPKELALKITGKTFPKWKGRNNNYCHCVEMVDIGAYNTCCHFCKYCYANYDEKNINNNIKMHYSDSSLLVGYINEDDEIKIRKK